MSNKSLSNDWGIYPICGGGESPIMFCQCEQLCCTLEDDQDEVFLLRRAFDRAKQNYHFFHAENGEEAINYLNGEKTLNVRAATNIPCPRSCCSI